MGSRCCRYNQGGVEGAAENTRQLLAVTPRARSKPTGLTSISALYVWKGGDREFEEDTARTGSRERPPPIWMSPGFVWV